MYPLNPDMMFQDMRDRRERMLSFRPRARRAPAPVSTPQVADTGHLAVVIPLQRQPGQIGQAPRSGTRPAATDTSTRSSRSSSE